MESSCYRHVKVPIASIVASVVVSIGALIGAVVQGQTEMVAIDPMSTGVTTTTTIAPTTAPIREAHPSLKATRPQGYL
jgi:hypothetical protein